MSKLLEFATKQIKRSDNKAFISDLHVALILSVNATREKVTVENVNLDVFKIKDSTGGGDRYLFFKVSDKQAHFYDLFHKGDLLANTWDMRYLPWSLEDKFKLQQDLKKLK